MIFNACVRAIIYIIACARDRYIRMWKILNFIQAKGWNCAIIFVISNNSNKKN